jgi:hypothetical protein
MSLVTRPTCERYRPITTTLLAVVLIAATFAFFNHEDGRLWRNARRLTVGLSRNKVIQVMGEPQEKKTVGSLVEYCYWTMPIGSKSTREVGGIYLDSREEHIVDISLTYGWTEIAGRDLNFMILYGIFALEGLLAWWLIRTLCRRRASPENWSGQK